MLLAAGATHSFAVAERGKYVTVLLTCAPITADGFVNLVVRLSAALVDQSGVSSFHFLTGGFLLFGPRRLLLAVCFVDLFVCMLHNIRLAFLLLSLRGRTGQSKRYYVYM